MKMKKGIVKIPNKKAKKIAGKEKTQHRIPRAAAATAQDIGARENQQDNCCVYEAGVNCMLAVVADGMGGLENGAEISGIVTYVFREAISRRAVMTGQTIDYPEIELLTTLKTANEQVLDYINNAGGGMSGSTVVAVYLTRNKLYFLSVGDSHLYLMRKGRLILLNREHTYAYELDEKVVQGTLTLERALSDGERKCLTSYVGMDRIEHLDRNITPITLCVGDKLLLVSDGVFGTLSDAEMEQAMSASTPQIAANTLEEMVRSKNKPRQDNSTSVVIFYE
jgi:protein phosphatase